MAADTEVRVKHVKPELKLHYWGDDEPSEWRKAICRAIGHRWTWVGYIGGFSCIRCVVCNAGTSSGDLNECRPFSILGRAWEAFVKAIGRGPCEHHDRDLDHPDHSYSSCNKCGCIVDVGWLRYGTPGQLR